MADQIDDFLVRLIKKKWRHKLNNDRSRNEIIISSEIETEEMT